MHPPGGLRLLFIYRPTRHFRRRHNMYRSRLLMFVAMAAADSFIETELQLAMSAGQLQRRP